MSSLGSVSKTAAATLGERRTTSERNAPPFGKSIKGNEGYNALMRGDTVIVSPKNRPDSIMALRVVSRTGGEYATDTVHLRPHGIDVFGAGRRVLTNENLTAATSERTNVLQVVTRGSQDATVLHGDSYDARNAWSRTNYARLHAEAQARSGVTPTPQAQKKTGAPRGLKVAQERLDRAKRDLAIHESFLQSAARRHNFDEVQRANRLIGEAREYVAHHEAVVRAIRNGEKPPKMPAHLDINPLTGRPRSEERAAEKAAKAAANAKPKAEVTQTHTQGRTKWHEVTVTYPNGTKAQASINAKEFPTKTAAKAEAIRVLQEGYNGRTSSVVNTRKSTYDSTRAQLGVTPNERDVVPGNHRLLATLAREEGRSDLAAIHDRIADIARDYYTARAASAMNPGRSKAATAKRAEAETRERAAHTRLRQAQHDLGAQEIDARVRNLNETAERFNNAPKVTEAEHRAGVAHLEAVREAENAVRTAQARGVKPGPELVRIRKEAYNSAVQRLAPAAARGTETVIGRRAGSYDAHDLRAATNQWAARMSVKPTSITIGALHGKWGQMNTAGHMTISSDVQKLPTHLADYVIVHELAHRLAPDHGRMFKTYMSAYMSDWQQRDTELRSHGGGSLD